MLLMIDNYDSFTYNLVQYFGELGEDVRVVRNDAADVAALAAMHPDRVCVSPGPCSPKEAGVSLEAIKYFAGKVPVLGVCLGHQIMGLACGGKTLKMKFGHHGGNHPVVDLKTKRVYITSQNHGFAVDAATLPEGVEASHKSLFDGSLQGLRFVDAPAISFQGHPEASPGPHDIAPLFDRFAELMRSRR